MDYYKRPIWKNPIFIFLLVLFFVGILFVYYSITKPIEQSNLSNNFNVLKNNKKIFVKLTYKEGKVRLIDRLTQKQKKISINSIIKNGDILKTFTDSKAVVRFGPLILRLDENTEIQILETNSNKIIISQLKGRTYSRLSSKLDYTIKTLFSEFNIKEKSAFSLDSNIKDKYLDIFILEGNLQTKIFRENVPIAEYTLKSKTKNTIYPYNPLKNILKTESIEIQDFLGKNFWLKWNYSKDLQQNLQLDSLENIELPKSIILNGYYKDGKVYLDWKLDQGKAVKGFRIVMAKDDKIPEYPNDRNHFIPDNNATQDIWTGLSNGTYNFRVGLYDGISDILLYSNNVKIIIDENSKISEKLELNVEQVNENLMKLSWNKLNIPVQGFYVLYDSENIPRYPVSEYIEISSDKVDYVLKNLDTNLSYNFRICAIIQGNCALYSNVVKKSFSRLKTKIDLKAKVIDNSVELFWNVNRFSKDNNGFRILMSEDSKPNLTNSIIKIIDSKNTNSFLWKNLQRGKTYYFVVCEYLGNNTCGVFSNIISTYIQDLDKSVNNGSIKIKAFYTWGKIHINWKVEGLQDFDNFVTLLDEKPNLKYPNEKFHLIDKQTFYDSWTVEADKVYFIKVCALKNNSCILYSKELKVDTNY